MRYVPLLWLSVACLAVALCVAPSAGPCAAGEPTAEQVIDALIAQLGSDSFEAREAAARRLAERDDAIPALRRARKSPDPEVARRAGDILDALARREQKRALAAFADLAKGGAVDRAVEKFVRRDRWEDEAACWKVWLELADKVETLAEQSYGKASRRVAWKDSGVTLDSHDRLRLAPYLRMTGLPLDGAGQGPHLWGDHLVLRAGEIQKGERFHRFLIAVSGKAETRELNGSIMFCGGSASCDPVQNSVVVCDGDFTARDSVDNSLIIARGTIACDGPVSNTRLIAGGAVRLKHPGWGRDSKVVEKEAKPLGFVKFFDPADVGIKVESADGGARVKSAEKGKPFAAADVRADDIITAVNGKDVKDAESFRRLLRASLAVDGETVLKLRRDKQVSEVRVPAPK